MYEPTKILSIDADVIKAKQEQDLKDFKENIDKYKIDINEEMALPDIVLSVCDADGNNKRMVMTRQNISCITAQAKVGKSFLTKLIVSACLQKNTFQNRLHSEMPEGKDKILFIDTEQSKFHVQLGLKQIRSLVPDFENESHRIDVYQFDAVSTETRYKYVKELIYSKKYSLVVLDGISDLTIDTNDLKLADALVTDLRIWATECDLHIINIIHSNPGDASRKMKGHLGTKLADKSETVLGISIDKDNDANRIVQSLASRNRKADAFAFEITENGMPNILDDFEIRTETKPKKLGILEIDDRTKFEILEAVYKNGTEFRFAKLGIQLQIALRTFGKEYGINAIGPLIEYCKNKKWLLQTKEQQPYTLGVFKEIKPEAEPEAEAENGIDF